ncbi:MAG: hypothetical protein PUK40_02120 [Actinomycetaceae bacterium]|nr:hypothetical protein [Arcanobacterium sp.]MDD7504737.1 hypothetical protein [Actinomycetaceae bacterium]MDY6142740.1 hypothetical protein [Arcanobacterium sp.]
MDIQTLTPRIARRLEANIGDTATLAPQDATQIAADAARLVTDYIGTATVPEEVAELAGLQVARELHTQMQAPGGIYSGFADGAPVRLARDPLKPAYPLLASYVGGGFA